MAIQFKQDGIYIDGILKIPADKQVLIDGVYDKLVTNGLKTVNGESILGTGNIEVQSKLLQVITLQNSETYYFNTRNEVELPGLNTTITPKDPNSTFLVFGTLMVSKPYVSSIALKFGDNWVNPVLTNNDYHDNSFMVDYCWGNSTGCLMPKTFVHSFKNPGITNPTYFGVYFKNSWRNSGYAFYYNNRADNDMGSMSSVIVMEVLE